jgi:hypothetical protein
MVGSNPLLNSKPAILVGRYEGEIQNSNLFTEAPFGEMAHSGILSQNAPSNNGNFSCHNNDHTKLLQ